MGSYKSAIVTSAGESLIAQVLAGNKAITFSSAKTSSYAYPAGTNIKALTGLQDVVQTVTPFSAEVFSDVIVQVSSRFSNEDVSAEYPMNTIGIYAQAEGEAEQLFAVVQAITPYIMEAQSPTSPQGYIFNVQITVQQASQLTVTVNPAGTATVQDILDVKADIAAVENPEFDDSGNVSTITDYNSFYNSIVSKMSIFDFFRNLKAGLKYLVNVGQIVNNGTTNQAGFVMDARQANPDIQGTLANQISVLNAKTSTVTVNIPANGPVSFNYPVGMTKFNIILIGVKILTKYGVLVDWSYGEDNMYYGGVAFNDNDITYTQKIDGNATSITFSFMRYVP